MTQANAAEKIISDKRVAGIYPTDRLVSIDRYRGLAVFCMILFQFIGNFNNLGFLTRIASHSLENGIVILPGMVIADIIAPLFIFVIGLTYKVSYEKRKKIYGQKAATVHFAVRYLSLIGLGGFLFICRKIFDGDKLNGVDLCFLVLAAIAITSLAFRFVCCFLKNEKLRKVSSFCVFCCFCELGVLSVMIALNDFAVLNTGAEGGLYHYWLTLQAIGAAGLIALPFIKLKTEKRLVFTVLMFILFTFYHEIGNEALIDVVAQGGFWGSFGWASVLLFASVFADLYYTGFKYYLIAVAVFAVPAIFSVLLFGHINKGSVSPAYVLVSTEICALGFVLFHFFGKIKLRFDFFTAWGKNPIVMFLLEFFVVGLYTGVMPETFIAKAPLWLAVVQVVLMTALLTLLAWLLARSKRTFKI